MEIDWNQTEEAVRLAERIDRSRVERGNDEIEGFFSQPIPERLWHYTTLEGLQGILNSGRVWATEVHSTNDAKEFTVARDVAKNFLEQQQASSPEQESFRKACIAIIESEFKDGWLSEVKSEVFIASFSAAANLKSQWMEYAKQGQGVSIAFDLRNIRPPREFGVAVTLSPCVYERQKQEQLLEAALSHFGTAVKRQGYESVDRDGLSRKLHDWQLVDSIYGLPFNRPAFDRALEKYISDSLRSGLAMSRFDLMRVASCCKHPFFTEEQEWRLSLPHTKGTPLTHVNIEYRGQDGNIPYVAHNLFHNGQLPIVEVMTGPFCADPNEVRELLTQHGYHAPVVSSDSPIRRMV